MPYLYFRMFSRDNNKLDYQLFFRTRGAFRSLGWNKLILTVCFVDVLVWMMIWNPGWKHNLPTLFLAVLVIGKFLSPGAARLLVCKSLCHVISLWSPMIAIVLLGPSIPYSYGDDFNELDKFHNHKFILRNSMAKWIIYLVLLVVVLLLTISKLRFPRVIKLVDCVLGRILVSWHRVIINLCMCCSHSDVGVNIPWLISICHYHIPSIYSYDGVIWQLTASSSIAAHCVGTVAAYTTTLL